MPRGTTRDSKTGIPVSWRKHLAEQVRAKNPSVPALAAELHAQEILEIDWRRTSEKEVLTEGAADGPDGA